jgi:hypothetical protein
MFGGTNLRGLARNGGRVPNNSANQNISTDVNSLRLRQFGGADVNTSSPLSVSALDVMRQVNNGTASGSSVASGSGGAGGYTYTWTNSSGATMSVNGATATFSSTRSVSGSATVTVRDAAGATASRTIIVDLTVGRPL